MQLKNPMKSPPGGWWVKVRDAKGKAYRVPKVNAAGSLDGLVKLVERARDRLGMLEVGRGELKAWVEDEICRRLSFAECWSTGSGDTLHKLIVTAASTVDKVTKGRTQLKRKAKGCEGCAKRRRAMNRQKVR